MILNSIKMTGTDEIVHIAVDDDRITNISSSEIDAPADTIILTFDNAIIFPGLINSHDHLDFNLFPQLGNRIYSSYTEWGEQIHLNHKIEIENVLKIPEPL